MSEELLNIKKKEVSVSNFKKEIEPKDDFKLMNYEHLPFVDYVNGVIVFDINKMLNITSDNYYDLAADRQYMNSTQYKSWLKCEAAEYARLNGEYEEEEKRAYILGNYLHAWNDGTMEEYCQRYKNELFKNGGGKYADVIKIDKIINQFENDEFIMFMLNDKNSEKEVIFVAYFAGAWWKVRVDDLNRDMKRLIDLKTTRGFDYGQYDKDAGKYLNFIEWYNYPLQMAIYEKATRVATNNDERWEVFIIAGDKPSKGTPDKKVINMTDHTRFDTMLEDVEYNMYRILKVKYGIEKPTRCGKCEYCKQTKQLDHAVYYKELQV